MSEQRIIEYLKDLDFVLLENIFSLEVQRYENTLNPYIQLAIQETKQKFPEVAYIYFRRFPNDSRAPIAQAYIFDFTDWCEIPETFGETVKNIWLTGKIPLIYAFTKTDIRIISGFEKPEYQDKAYKFSIIDTIKIAHIANTTIFSAKRLDNGSFWDEPQYAKHFNFKNSPYEILLKKIKQMLQVIIDKEQQLSPENSKPFYQKLILRSILIKYLEDRTDENNDGVFPKGYFSEISGTEDSFVAILNKPGTILSLFKKLETDFNGNIFSLSSSEIDILRDKDLSLFSDVFNCKVDDHSQMLIWDLYSFNYLPIELISNIYEEFMPKTEGVVYTPPFLVDFLVDQAMPLTDLQKKGLDYKVIDPSCGSGVFLVAAYKRIVQAWKLQNPQKDASIDVLKQILRKCIFGIDIEKQSIELAAFSLTIALCDQLSPKNIRELKFDDLTVNNLLNQDFFTVVLNEDGRYNDLLHSFDLVIGNPPFDSKLKTKDANEVERKQQKIRGCVLPDKQVSLLFLEQSHSLLTEEGNCLLIQKSAPLLYNTTATDFVRFLFKSYNIYVIYDFSVFKPHYFKTANVEIAAVCSNNSKKLSKSIFHFVIPNTLANKHKYHIEIDPYDIHRVLRSIAITDRDVWKHNLLGGSRLNALSNKIKSFRTLKSFLDSKKEHGWCYSEGYKVLNPKKRIPFMELKRKSNRSESEELTLEKLEHTYKAEYITGKPTLNLNIANCFTSYGISKEAIYLMPEQYFESKLKRSKVIFEPPHILLRETIDHLGIPVEFRSDFLSFTKQVIGVHSSDTEELIKIETWIKHNRILVFCVILNSGRNLSSRPGSFLMGDILSIPYPEDPKALEFTDFEKILIDDVLNYQIDFRRKGEKAKAMKPVARDNLNDFAEIFLKVLNSVYKDFHSAKPILTTSFVCFPFYYGNTPEDDLEELSSNENALDMHLQSLLNHQHSSTLRINRVLRIYNNNVIYLIKPKQLRYWLRSIAMRDADEIIADFIHKGF